MNGVSFFLFIVLSSIVSGTDRLIILLWSQRKQTRKVYEASDAAFTLRRYVLDKTQMLTVFKRDMTDKCVNFGGKYHLTLQMERGKKKCNFLTSFCL